MTGLDRVPPGVDPNVPSSARVYDYLLGGKDNLAIDRAIAERLLAVAPDTRLVARANRDFLVRTVRFMAERGVRQFIDLGTGIPTSPSVHEVAHEIDPSATVVYVDYDPVVHLHTEVLLTRDKNVVSVQADIRRPGAILDDPQVVGLVDFSQPVGVLMVGVLHFITDAEDPAGVIAAFRERMAAGSHLTLSHAMAESAPEAMAQLTAATANSPAQSTFRSHDQVLALLDGFELLEPGLVPVHDWRNGDGFALFPDAERPKLRIDGALARLSRYGLPEGPGRSGRRSR
ncbi:SAM-dependent methyltransferase [Streptosporangium minutum]|uniref:Methyltransferase n=1 Tax=Streptosporangium minutum TaxID=569862 RepID=A0A243REE6_9ACTN|nr:SAM-dependent methyltransferase [Streptosporangium minutum]OUC92397.1 methyltransferase [Streptosporangium minutum]